jgi:hypothetical protein
MSLAGSCFSSESAPREATMFAFCSPSAAMLAQKIKLLAHDNKLHAGCLLNLPARAADGTPFLKLPQHNLPRLVGATAAPGIPSHSV